MTMYLIHDNVFNTWQCITLYYHGCALLDEVVFIPLYSWALYGHILKMSPCRPPESRPPVALREGAEVDKPNDDEYVAGYLDTQL